MKLLNPVIETVSVLPLLTGLLFLLNSLIQFSDKTLTNY